MGKKNQYAHEQPQNGSNRERSCNFTSHGPKRVTF